MPKKLDHASACEHLTRVDRQLARIIARWGPCSLQQETTQSIFEALLESIIYQQLNGKVAATITARVKALFPENTKRIRTRRGLVDGFPTPEQILAATEEHLRSAGLSRAKMLAIRDLAAKALDGTVPTVTLAHRMSDEELIERLDTVRGIGRWTVEMMLMFQLQRPDVLPVDDFGVRNGFRLAYRLRGMPTPRALAQFGERWKPYRSVAAWYLWRAVDLARRNLLPRCERPPRIALQAPPKKMPKKMPQQASKKRPKNTSKKTARPRARAAR